jgi:hypothetical protein
VRHQLNGTNTQPDNGSGRCCQYRFFEVELSILFEQIYKPIDEVVSVGVILGNRPPLGSTSDNVLQCSRAPILVWHAMMNKHQN